MVEWFKQHKTFNHVVAVQNHHVGITKLRKLGNKLSCFHAKPYE